MPHTASVHPQPCSSPPGTRHRQTLQSISQVSNTFCNTLQHTHCNTLCNTLQHTHCKVSPKSATHCATHCNTLCNRVWSKLDRSKLSTGWRRPIGCLKLQIIFRKRATKYRALLRKMTYKDKTSDGSSPPCCKQTFEHRYLVRNKVIIFRQRALELVALLRQMTCNF